MKRLTYDPEGDKKRAQENKDKMNKLSSKRKQEAKQWIEKAKSQEIPVDGTVQNLLENLDN